ncbi:alpha/beta fold hydrolase [Alloacidobacterium dinghuense]|uniref:Alpha/beta fold hydrolase n=1 Tax=Alloacidobacterium dinghuense TaxID=2763107 RepID=A0A7G8BEL3_9BACT|nr:alpha/beta fold hydrolase [Alloacidobacterium dinghuense]QNI30983.1 alpha/beta fold hydrolase [Alloacidobacterium dinghuense]
MHRLLILLLVFSPAAWTQQTAPTNGMVKTPDVDLAYEVYGAASANTPVIAVNGGPGLSHKYMLQNDVWSRLSQKRQIVFYDQRGTGKSQRVSANASQGMDAQVADLEAVRAHLGFEKVDLVGDSYGGLLSMAYVSAHPEHVRKLILSDSAPPAWKEIVHLLPQVFPDVEEQDAAIGKKLGNTDEAAQQELINHFRMIFYSQDLMHKYLDGIGDIGYVPKVGEAVGKATENIDLTAQLPKFTQPTLIITGRFDMNVAPLTAWRMYKAIPGAKLEIFEKSGHLSSYEEPDKYVQIVDTFLSGQ